MTHPLTPREKVAQIVDPWAFEFEPWNDNWKSVVARRQTEALEKADAILTALASGSGDHAELAAKAERCTTGDPWYKDEDLRGRQSFGQFLSQDRAFIAAANPATVLALLAENAALRGENEHVKKLRHQAIDRSRLWEIDAIKWETRATEAERKLAEAVGLLAQARSWAPTTGPLGDKISKFLSKEAERG